MKSYPEYKFVPGLVTSQIPSHWNSSKIKYLAKIQTGTTPSIAKEDAFQDDSGLPWLTPDDLDETGEPSRASKFLTIQGEEEVKPLAAGSTLICCIGSIGKAGIIDSEASSNQQINAATFHESSKFGFYSILSCKNAMECMATGNVLRILNSTRLGGIEIAVPPMHEREQIIQYLDRETAKIDALIAEQERLIELLQKKQQAVISHAVTKGLNPSAQMKDSGVEWLGEVPEHWKTLQLRYSLGSLSQGSSPTCAQGPAEKGQYGVLKTGCVNQIDFVPSENKALPDDIEPELSSEIRPGDVLMSRGNTKELVGLAAFVPAGIEKLLASDLIFILRFNTTITIPEFAVLFIRSIAGRHQIEPRTVGTSASMQKINQSTIKSFILALPPIEEQYEITSRLKASIDESEQLLKQSRKAVNLLQERRSALISAAVTGQIDVRGLVPEEVTA